MITFYANTLAGALGKGSHRGHPPPPPFSKVVESKYHLPPSPLFTGSNEGRILDMFTGKVLGPVQFAVQLPYYYYVNDLMIVIIRTAATVPNGAEFTAETPGQDQLGGLQRNDHQGPNGPHEIRARNT